MAVRSKYANAAQCLRDVRALRGRVLHGVDATRLHELPARLPDGARVPAHFSHVVFNFPHSGQQRVHVNRALLRDFFESARARLTERGEVHVTLKTRPPYSNWLVEQQAAAADFVLKERRKFDITLFPGYHHRTTDPLAKTFEPELCVTYVFVVNRAKVRCLQRWLLQYWVLRKRKEGWLAGWGCRWMSGWWTDALPAIL